MFGGGLLYVGILQLLIAFDGGGGPDGFGAGPGLFLAAFTIIPLVAAPFVIASLATFGAIAAVVVDRIGTPRYAALGIIFFFTTVPILIFAVIFSYEDETLWQRLAGPFSLAGPFAFAAALSLWHEMLKRKWRIEGSMPS
ncbi:hypothetical protein P8R33_10830 [Qipengyuania sp. XHP0211]|uniref:hypothetical protein n=1 Tax=Qipengyuania sp. XHP0211 TaxID=3038079 RepID=UPI00241C884D|nr:hypothetical protein [Qipengyuania sp. XHP0211]MDG5751602.1 hypothetical protein [Qipengyuania sp. XHP0211]